MTGVYLSLNQGVTEVIENYKARASDILKRRAKDFRDKLEFTEDLISEIDLNSTNQTPIFYEYGNIVAKFYPANNLPDSDELLNDILLFLKLYDQIIYNDTTETEETQLTAIEKKQVRLHYRIERNSSISKKVKKAKGYKCEACSFEFSSKYGELGDEFVEAHHLTPIATLEIGKIELNLINDFAVLCSNCHKMIHRLKDPSDLTYFKTLIKN